MHPYRVLYPVPRDGARCSVDNARRARRRYAAVTVLGCVVAAAALALLCLVMP